MNVTDSLKVLAMSFPTFTVGLLVFFIGLVIVLVVLPNDLLLLWVLVLLGVA